MEFHELSYKLHEDNYKPLARGAERAGHAKTWRESDTVDAWRHERMYRVLDPLIDVYPKSTWLTVGDGRFGSDAHYLHKKGMDVMATDISDVLLKEAYEEGYIGNYRRENAEALSFDDGSFDFVFCKESFHHFPRPMLALYEMLRVCRVGVILLEPNDTGVNAAFATKVKFALKRMVKYCLRKKTLRHHYEEAGNYVYAFSRREIEKVALGLNYRTVAFRGVNDCYISGVEFAKAEATSALFKKIRRKIRWRNFTCKVHLADYALLAAIILKIEISPELELDLSRSGCDVMQLPKNPYAEGDFRVK